MAVRIVTDTVASISPADKERLAIATVAIHVYNGSEPLSEEELSSTAFYARLADMDSLPTTSQPSPAEFAEVFRGLLADGHEVLAVLVSGGLSGTVASAEAAVADIRAASPDARIGIVDSLSNSLEEGYAVLAAAEAAAAGASLEECRRAAEETMRRTRLLFTPHSLEYLRRGGRITGASALLSMMLRIVPILTAEKGVTGIAGVGRSGTSAWAKVVSIMKRDIEKAGVRQVAVQYISDADEAQRFATEVVEPVVGRKVPIVPIHAVVGIHVGPAVGVVYETEEPLR
ncbi:MAG: DegV family protein [Coriobacteriia bacterium]|nr:DegV family protein [Coriobacteriia bacterium]